MASVGSSVATGIGFIGEWLNATGLVNLRFRQYDPVMGSAGASLNYPRRLDRLSVGVDYPGERSGYARPAYAKWAPHVLLVDAYRTAGDAPFVRIRWHMATQAGVRRVSKTAASTMPPLRTSPSHRPIVITTG